MLSPALDEDKRLAAVAQAMKEGTLPVVRGSDASVGTEGQARKEKRRGQSIDSRADFDAEAAALDQDREVAEIQTKLDARRRGEDQRVQKLQDQLDKEVARTVAGAAQAEARRQELKQRI